jgi:hypothetical protein
MEVATQMRAASSLAELAAAIHPLFIEFVEASVGVRLQGAAAVLQELSDMFTLSVGAK